MTVTALVTAMAVVKGLGGGKVTPVTRHQIFHQSTYWFTY
jgi:hypothetical protein